MTSRWSRDEHVVCRLESLELFKFIVSFDLADNLQTISSLRKLSIFSERHEQVMLRIQPNKICVGCQMFYHVLLSWTILCPCVIIVIAAQGSMPIPYKILSVALGAVLCGIQGVR